MLKKNSSCEVEGEKVGFKYNSEGRKDQPTRATAKTIRSMFCLIKQASFVI